MRRSLFTGLTIATLCAGTPALAARVDVATGLVEANGGDGKCSLAEAIIAATKPASSPDCIVHNNGADPFTINLPNGYYYVATALPTLASLKPLIINGPNATLAGPGASATSTFGLLTINNNKPVTLNGLTLTGGRGTTGGCLQVSAGTVSFSGTIQNCTATQSGGGIYVAAGSTLALNNSVITTNVSMNHGGGIANLGTAAITSTRVEHNRASSQGGGIYFANGTALTLQSSSVTNNAAYTQGGGLYQTGTGTSVVQNSTISSNNAQFGGGLYMQSSPATSAWTHVTITNNTASQGGGMILATAAKPTINNSLIARNNGTNNKECLGILSNVTSSVFSDQPGINCIVTTSADPLTTNWKFPIADLPLTELALHGNLTKSHLLKPGNKAIDLLPTSPLTTDQRDGAAFGRPYPVQGAYDAGAIEFVSCATCVEDIGFDNDGDGVSEAQGDTDDNNAQISGPDLDGDGFFPPADCNNTDSTVHPNAAESCGADGFGDGIDNNCNNQIDEAIWDIDYDADGYAGASETPTALIGLCNTPVAGTSGVVVNGIAHARQSAGIDCDDTNNAIHPQHAEACNNLDDDCDGLTDEAGNNEPTSPSLLCQDNNACTIDVCAAGTCQYSDQACDDNNACTADSCDAVTGCANAPIAECTANDDLDGDGVTVGLGDCNDTDPTIHSGAVELCNFRDDNCNQLVDDGLPMESIGLDKDGDKFPGSVITHCLYPTSNAQVQEFYTHFKGFPTHPNSGVDCNDGQYGINPGLTTDICDGIDNDCDNTIDEDKWTMLPDLDGDGFAAKNTPLQAACSTADLPADLPNRDRYIRANMGDPRDCNDTTAVINPSAAEVSCNSVDDNCNGSTDEGSPILSWYPDADQDGAGDATAQPIQSACPPAGVTTAATHDDCNDSNAAILPGAAEMCGDSIDNNCDGTVDTPSVWFRDGDGDGFGNPAQKQTACEKPEGYATLQGDCNDTNAQVAPGKIESCNSIDDNCNGSIDEGNIGASWFRDFDGDGVGGSMQIAACTQPQGYSLDTGDCDDSTKKRYPGAVERCDKIDNNCNGIIDDSANCSVPDNNGDDGGSTPPEQPNDNGTPPPATPDDAGVPSIPDMGGSSAPLGDTPTGDSSTNAADNADATNDGANPAASGGVMIVSEGGCSLII